MSTDAPTAEKTNLRWFQGVDRYCWIVLAIAALGWLFDTMDQNLFNLVRTPSTKELILKTYDDRAGWPAEAAGMMGRGGTLEPGANGRYTLEVTDGKGEKHRIEAVASPKAATLAEKGVVVGYDQAQGVYQLEAQKKFDGDVSQAAGILTAVFLIGWSVGGFLFGMLGDRIGRTGTMIATILIYALFTGLSGLAMNLPFYGAMRFFTALGVGGEWAAGAALVAEVFPSRSRPMALGFLQACSSVGNMLAAVITLLLAGLSWRWAYAVGAIPALLVLYIRRNVKEPEKWEAAKHSASSSGELGNIAALFRNPILRRNTIAGTLLAAAGVGALWGVGFFSVDLIRAELTTAGWKAAQIDQCASIMFLLQNFGSFFGIMAFAAFAERFGRKVAFGLSFTLAWASILAFFWGVSGKESAAYTWALVLAPIMGFCTLGPFSGYTVYFPELFPTRLRSTGCGFCYNAARVLAAAAPFVLGGLKSSGMPLAVAATMVSSIYLLGYVGTVLGPETRGKPLPE